MFWAQSSSSEISAHLHHGPMRAFSEHLFNGPYKLMHLLLKMGWCRFFQCIRVVCMWVLPTTMIIYATWAPLSSARCASSCTAAPPWSSTPSSPTTRVSNTLTTPTGPSNPRVARSVFSTRSNDSGPVEAARKLSLGADWMNDHADMACPWALECVMTRNPLTRSRSNFIFYLIAASKDARTIWSSTPRPSTKTPCCK